MKVAPLLWEAERLGIQALLIHTGQHHDQAMSRIFFDQLGIPMPHRNLGVGGGTHGEVTGRCIEGLEKVFIEESPAWVVVVGDVNSTLAGAIAASKLGLPLAHVEAGLRSFDRSMPEELNRLVVDAISDIHLVSEPSGVKNLLAEGKAGASIHLVGNVMIDTLERFRPLARERKFSESLGFRERSFGLVTLHRPFNVDHPENFGKLLNLLEQVVERIPLIFPVHPRTRSRLEQVIGFKDFLHSGRLLLLEPLGYIDFMSLMIDARVVLTDSGGIQEETTVLGVPCLTLRDNTERPITIEQGTNRLVGAMGQELLPELKRILEEPFPSPARPDLWDGKAAERILRILGGLR
ncbi:MAG: UDP-N-acetylglucosamine 2-epimerase (non-hydrolyzing) [Holophagaceae bacterium]|nr:UDP-N-acetylglucosamine 2-epimerase (non-hydrolyzing) [Holophagaceae bacterium]